MAFEWVFIDADGTLFDYDRAEAIALRETFSDCELAWSDLYMPLYHRFNSEVWAEFERGEIGAAALRAERFRRMFEHIDIAFDPVDFSARYLPNLAKGGYLLPGALELVERLRKHCRLALITNGLKDVQRPRLRASAISAAFDVVAISEEIGAAKPAAEYFDWVMKAAGNPRHDRVLAVGDSLSADIRGAVGYGLPCCWFNPSEKPLPDGFKPVWVARTLEEVAVIALGGGEHPSL